MLKPPPENEKPGGESAISTPGETKKASFSTGEAQPSPPPCGNQAAISATSGAAHEPLALDLLLTADQRRPSANERQIAFQAAISTPSRAFDGIDEECEIDPLLLDRPAQRRTNAQTSQLLDILDELDASGKGWEG